MDARYMNLIVAAALFCLVNLPVRVRASFRLEVTVFSYSNPGNLDYDGGCCEFFSCSDTCETYFLFCLRNINYEVIDNRCPRGSHSTIHSPISASSITFTPGQPIVSGVPNPLGFTGNSWPGSFQLMVRVRDEDNPDADDLIDRVVINSNLAVGSSISARNYLGIYGKATMRMAVTIECDTNFYGSDCTRFCVPRDDSLGHFMCDSNGDIVCLLGWTNSASMCTTPICAPGCSPTGGYCIIPGECSCHTGWRGDLCDECIPITGCHTDRATCNLPGECICTDSSYSGSLCQIDNDVCGHVAPCQNGATCTNLGPDDYSCACPPGYTGTNCNINIDECDSTPCLNGGTCTDGLADFTCTCAPGWTGVTCGDNIDECLTPPCVNGGTCRDCVPSSSLSVGLPDANPEPCINGYICDCPAGFFGVNCEVDIDYCVSTPCHNNGTCEDINGGPGYLCVCVTGYTGTDCETEIDECASTSCQNGGSCMDLVGSYHCTCPAGFTGNDCQTNIDDCANAMCHDNNTHECRDGINSFTCVCHPGYTGQLCEIEIDECDHIPCMNGATCLDLLNDFSCQCPIGFTGAICATNIDDCHSDFCLFNGTCIDEINGYRCKCVPGYSGRQCETLLPPACQSNPCNTNELCIDLLPIGHMCEPCQPGEESCPVPAQPGLDPDVLGVNPGSQRGNGTTPGSIHVGTIVGSVIGGVVGALLLLCLLLVCICCCCRCCCCRDKYEMKEVGGYETMTWPDKAVAVGNNPTYFGTNTLLSSRSGTMSTQNGSLPRNEPGQEQHPLYAPPNVPAANAWRDRSLQNPVYFSQLKASADSASTPVPPPPNGPLSADDEHPYDTIPAMKGVSPSVPIPQGGYGYASLVESPTPGPVKSEKLLESPEKSSIAASGRYDKLGGQTAENPYVVGPDQPHVVLPSATPQISEPENPEKKKQDGADQNDVNIPIPPSTSTVSPYDSLPQSK